MRIGWETVGNILARVVAEKLDRGRLDGLVLIGVDEVSYGADHKFLTCVADHQTAAAIVWAAAGPQRRRRLQAFFDELTDEQKASIRAVSIDMSAGYEKAIREAVPDAQVVLRPVPRRAARRQGGRPGPPRRVQPARPLLAPARASGSRAPATRLLKDPANQTAEQLLKLAEVVTTNKRDVPRVPASTASCATSTELPKARSRRAPRRVAGVGVPLASQTVRQARPHDPQAQAGVLAAIQLGHQQRTPRSAQQPASG